MLKCDFMLTVRPSSIFCVISVYRDLQILVIYSHAPAKFSILIGQTVSLVLLYCYSTTDSSSGYYLSDKFRLMR